MEEKELVVIKLKSEIFDIIRQIDILNQRKLEKLMELDKLQ